MEIRQIYQPDSKKFNQFVESHQFGSIHQLFEWGDFQSQTSQRDKFWALELEQKHLIRDHIHGSALLIKQKLPFGLCWLYCPQGPLTDYESIKESGYLVDYIARIARREKAVFTRFDPSIPWQKPHYASLANNFFQKIKSRPAHAHYMPESTLMIDLTLSEEDILKQMKQKGRYNIKVAKRHKVVIELKDLNRAANKAANKDSNRAANKAANNQTDSIKDFYNLLTQTTERDHFTGHSLDYYRKMIEKLGSGRVKLWFAYYKKKPLAAAIVTYFKGTATYYFGASSNQNRNVMAPYLLHWEIMLDAKSKGFKQYDFFGIAPLNSKGEADQNHPWAKVTEFKLKFGGHRLDYIPAQEVVYKPFWYFIVKMTKKIRQLKKHLIH